jgi:hypothetical protein
MGIGSLYILIEDIKTGESFRFPCFAEDKIPFGYRKKFKHVYFNGRWVEDVYDKNGELKSKYWGMKRVMPKGSDRIIIGDVVIKI